MNLFINKQKYIKVVFEKLLEMHVKVKKLYYNVIGIGIHIFSGPTFK